MTASLLYDQALNDWNENPLITTYDTVSAPIREVPFPSITICPQRRQAVQPRVFLAKFFDRYKLNCADTDDKEECEERMENKKHFMPVFEEFYQKLYDETGRKEFRFNME